MVTHKIHIDCFPNTTTQPFLFSIVDGCLWDVLQPRRCCSSYCHAYLQVISSRCKGVSSRFAQATITTNSNIRNDKSFNPSAIPIIVSFDPPTLPSAGNNDRLMEEAQSSSSSSSNIS